MRHVNSKDGSYERSTISTSDGKIKDCLFVFYVLVWGMYHVTSLLEVLEGSLFLKGAPLQNA